MKANSPQQHVRAPHAASPPPCAPLPPSAGPRPARVSGVFGLDFMTLFVHALLSALVGLHQGSVTWYDEVAFQSV